MALGWVWGTNKMMVELPAGIPTYSSPHALFHWPAGRPVSLHLYNDFDLWWIRKGEALLKFRTGEEICAGRDEFLLVPPLVPFWASVRKSPLVFNFCHFAFRPVTQRLTPELRSDFQFSEQSVRVPAHFTRLKAPGVAAAYRELAGITVSPDGPPWQLERALIKLVGELACFGRREQPRNSPAPAMQSDIIDPRLAALMRRIAGDPAFAWKVADLARSLDISPSHLHHIFKNATRKSLKEYLVERRLHQALMLFNEDSDGRRASIKAISHECGYSSQHFFSRQFKAHFGVSPRTYLRKLPSMS